MAEIKKSGGRHMDVSHPGTSSPSDTSKPVIVGNRPILKDPMVVEVTDNKDENSAKTSTKETVLQPSSAPELMPEAADKPVTELEVDEKKLEAEKSAPPVPVEETPPPEPTEEEKPTENEDKPAPADDLAATPEDKQKTPGELDAATDAENAKRDESIQKLIDSKKYYLPINSVEQRRSKRFVAAGVLISLLLMAAWINIALDAGLIELDGVKPLTHFFSN